MTELLAFLPGFSIPGRRFDVDETPPPGGEQQPAVMLHPIYARDVVTFFMAIGLRPWVDPNYRSLRPERFVAEPGLIERATWPELRALLNHCARGERFCDGYWSSVFQKGVVQAALRRLDQISSAGEAP